MLVSLVEFMSESKRELQEFLTTSTVLCRWLEEQHAAGVVLEQLTPHRIFLDRQKQAVEFRDSPNNLEQYLPYMSPEQAGRLKLPADARSNLYSLGVIFYQLLTDRLPFAAEDALGWSYAHTSLKPRSPTEVNNNIPPVVGEIVLKLLAKNPYDRYQSAAAVRADLERCYYEWQRKGTIAPFTLGLADSIRRMRSAGQLVGRDQELRRLQGAFRRVLEGAVEIVLIAGYPGIGKTALFEEFQNMVSEPKADFVRGDFDQFRTTAPYAVLLEILRERMRQILAAEPNQTAVWRDKFRDVLEKNGALITEIIPELELITGPFEAVAHQSALEAEQRFGRTFRDFVQLALGGEQPVVVFLDNLQWMDAASCQMLQPLFSQIEDSRLLFIGAYRSSEMRDDHPFFALLSSVQSSTAIPVNTIDLDALTKPQTQQLVCSLLPLEDDGLHELVDEVYSKSAGNPFLVKQILQKLYEDGSLSFSPQRLRWQYRGEAERETALPQGVIELVRERIKRLPGQTVEALKLAACLKQPFAIDSLAAILDVPVVQIQQHLQPALDAAIISEASRYPTVKPSARGAPPAPSFGFLHDQIRETVYALIPLSERRVIHRMAGKRLLAKAVGDSSDLLFEVVDHLNESAELIEGEAERLELAELNLKTAQKAKAMMALESALRYLTAALELLPSDHWQQVHRLSYEIYSIYYYCRFVVEGFDSAEPVFAELIKNAEPGDELVDAYQLKTILCTGYHTDVEAIKAGITGLRHLGLKIPMHPKPWDIAWEMVLVSLQFARGQIRSLLSQPPMWDVQARKTMELLADLVPPASLVNPELFVYTVLKMNRLTLRYGRCDTSAFAYACYAVVAYALGWNSPRITELQEVALELAESSSESMRYRTYYVVSSFLNHWNKHLQTSLEYAKQVHAAAYEHGDTIFAGAAVTDMVQTQHVLGESLDKLAELNEMALRETGKYGMQFLVDVLRAVDSYISSLKGETLDEYIIPRNTLQRMLETDSAMIVPYYYLMSIQVDYLRGDYAGAYAHVREISDKLESLKGKILYVEHIYWGCLATAAVYQDLEPREQNKALKQLRAYAKQLEKWSRWCPVNFLHKYKLVSAQLPQMKADHSKRMELYEEAIASAEKHGYILDAALASELAAHHYAVLGMDQYAEIYRRRAQDRYTRFGATGKARQLAGSTEPGDRLGEGTEQAAALDVSDVQPSSGSYLTDSESLPQEFSRLADFLTISKALDSLIARDGAESGIRKVLEITAASAGAQRVYVLAADGEQGVLAFREADGSCGSVLDRDSELDHSVAKSVVGYVVNTGKAVVVDNAVQSTVFGKDEYIVEHRPLSIQCVPIYLKDELAGVMYLENNLTVGAFSADRVEILQKLGALALSSIESHGGSRSAAAEASQPQVAELELLTDRERRILSLMALGLSNREIAERVYLSEGTVKWHTNKIFKKLGVQSRTQAVMKALEAGLDRDKIR